MEAELKEILTQLLEGQTEIKSDFAYISTTLTKIEANQEEIKSDISTLAELYEAHAEQYMRSLEGIDDMINVNVELFRTALTNTSKDLKCTLDSIDVLRAACRYQLIKSI